MKPFLILFTIIIVALVGLNAKKDVEMQVSASKADSLQAVIYKQGIIIDSLKDHVDTTKFITDHSEIKK